jgi:hypothetical protein
MREDVEFILQMSKRYEELLGRIKIIIATMQTRADTHIDRKAINCTLQAQSFPDRFNPSYKAQAVNDLLSLAPSFHNSSSFTSFKVIFSP